MSSLSRFTPSLMPAAQLERLFVAREPTLDRIIRRVREAGESSVRNHTLLVGARGAGKTHLVSLVAHRIQALIDEGASLQLAWLPEDPWRIASYGRLLRSVAELASEGVHAGVEVDAAPPGRSADPDSLERHLVTRARLAGPLIVIVENLDQVLHQIGRTGQQRLRHLLQDQRPILLVATTTAVDADLALQSAPFYGFFTTETLEPFTVEQARDMLCRVAEEVGDRPLAEYLETPEATARLQAIAHLAGGQPRLWTVLASGLTVRQLASLTDLMLTRFDDLTPYYQERLGRLSAQQRLVVAELADADRPLYVAALAERLGIEQRSLAKTVNELADRGWVIESSSPVVGLLDRRRTYYERWLSPWLGWRSSSRSPVARRSGWSWTSSRPGSNPPSCVGRPIWSRCTPCRRPSRSPATRSSERRGSSPVPGCLRAVCRLRASPEMWTMRWPTGSGGPGRLSGAARGRPQRPG